MIAIRTCMIVWMRTTVNWFYGLPVCGLWNEWNEMKWDLSHMDELSCFPASMYSMLVYWCLWISGHHILFTLDSGTRSHKVRLHRSGFLGHFSHCKSMFLCWALGSVLSKMNVRFVLSTYKYTALTCHVSRSSEVIQGHWPWWPWITILLLRLTSSLR